MILLVGPSPDEQQRYFQYRGHIIGPVGPKGQFRTMLSSFDTKLGSMVESKGFLGENGVVHEKVNAVLTYDPMYVSTIHDPIGPPYAYPDRVIMPTFNWAGQSSTEVATMGLACHESVSFSQQNNYFYQYACEMPILGDFNIVLWEIQGYAGYPTSAFRYELGPVISFDMIYAHFSVKTTQYSFPVIKVIDFDLSVKRQFTDIVGCITKNGTEVSATTVDVSPTWFFGRNTGIPICSPSVAKEAVEAVANLLLLQGNPLEFEDYGDLAMRASEKVNANKVNMFAFLRDLRDPKSMIPKLSNLGRLATHADNYLAIKYGILPTIDDLRSIVSACRRLKPYLDKNGFETFTSSSTKFKTEGGFTYTLEQHLKLALDDEDSDLRALVQSVESAGFLPTTEVVWDLIPYSFVVDWFVGVGDLLRRIDTRMRLTRLNVRYVTMSYKTTTTKSLVWSPSFPYSGFIQYGVYHRWVSGQCPTPPTSLHATFDGFDHWIESGALFLQHAKR